MVLSLALHRSHEPIKEPLMTAVDKMVAFACQIALCIEEVLGH